MSDIYLEKLMLKGFRSYKRETEISFPAGPGLTVIVGANGLGKSTLFDAVEWGLTNELRRLSATEGRASEKKAALGDKPEVQLWFSDTAHIYRSLTRETISNVNVANVKDWLTSEKWRGVSSIADCLQLTHFLGQSSRQMFVHLDGKERWGLLEGPAGLQALWKVESTLGRKQTVSGFNKVQEAFQRDERGLQEELTRIIELQEQLRAKRILERADEVLTPEEILSRCQHIDGQIALDINALGVSQEPSDGQVADIDVILQDQRIRLEKALQQLANQRAHLSQWTTLAQNYSDSIKEQTSLRQDREPAAQEFQTAENAASLAVNQTAAARQDHQSLVDQSSAQRSTLDAIVAEIERNRLILATDEKLQMAKSTAAALTTKSAEQARLIATNKETLETLNAQQNKQSELTDRGTSLKELFILAEDLIKLDAARQTARLELLSLPSDEALLKASIEERRQALAQLETEANALKFQRDAAFAASSAISAGVTQIASALRDEDCACPVCRTPFEIIGQLKKIASQQANVSDSRLVEIEAQIAEQAKKIETTRQNIFDLNSRIGRLQEKHLNLVSQITSTDKLEQSLRNTPLLSGLDIGEFLPTLSTAIGQNDNEAKELATLRSSSPDVIAVRAEGLRLANLQEDTDTEREKNATALANLERELDQLRNRPTSGKTPEQIQSSLLESDSALQNISQNVLESLAKLDLLQAEEDALKIKAADKKKLLDELDFKLTNLRQTEQDLAKRWSSNGYAGTPLPITVQRLDESLEHVSVRLQQVLQEHGVLLDGRRRYLANEELQQLEARLKAECDKHGVHNIESVLSKLDTQMLALKKRTESLSRVQEKRTNLLSQLKQKATDIRNAVSEPLNANTERFCAALMSDRAYPVSLSAIASATTAQALLSFQPDGKGEAKNPLLYMSEGQLAATSLCLLFGASATYPWSRWKGLLMDDPLHHNDSIHAAAFIDVVRNLIRSQGYQIIVSTHDMDQAGYFLRKCRNAGITARYHHLYGRADDGTALLQSA